MQTANQGAMLKLRLIRSCVFLIQIPVSLGYRNLKSVGRLIIHLDNILDQHTFQSRNLFSQCLIIFK